MAKGGAILRLRRQKRIIFLSFTCLVIFTLLVMRLGYIQLVQHERWSSKAVGQRMQALTLDYNRGDILDRHGVSLLGGEKERVLVVFPSLLRQAGQEIFEWIASSIPGVVLSNGPFIARRALDPNEEKIYEGYLSYGLVLTDAQRRYGPQALATHLVGHVGPADGKGKVGLEFTFNEELEGGSHSILAVAVDGKKRPIKGLGYRILTEDTPHAPYSLLLTIDGNIQQVVENIMDRYIARGSVVVMDPRNGDILAMASRPNYLQSDLPSYLEGNDARNSFLNTQPFINRSILGYPPGSVFKIVVAAAAIDTGEAWSSSRFYCPGYIEVGDTIFRCYQGKAHGSINLAEAFAHSCNSVFIKLALSLGRDMIYQYASAMGLGKSTGLPLGSPVHGGETEGKLPKPDEMPFLGDLALTAIGQGRVEATPLQIARLTAVIANGGFLVEPRLVQALQTKEGETIETFDAAPCRRVINPLTASRLRLMMSGVVEFGTGQAAGSEILHLGGKTGTAETEKLVNGKQLQYSWFTGLAPVEDCRAVITVFIEEPLQGKAPEVFRKIAETIDRYRDTKGS
jgi:penicillin-binding protein 2